MDFEAETSNPQPAQDASVTSCLPRERKPAESLRDKFSAISGWLASLTFTLVCEGCEKFVAEALA